jgi:hypothetical protein
VIADDGVFLMKPDEPASLDGRYFDPIPSASIVGQAEPISTFAKLLGRYSRANSERELFRPAAISSPSFRPTLVCSRRLDSRLTASRNQSPPPS